MKKSAFLTAALFCINVYVFAQEGVSEAKEAQALSADADIIQTVNASPGIDDNAAAAPAARPRIAVYVTGGKDQGENRALGTYILDALAAGRRYTAIERSESFLAEITGEQIKQRSGAINDSQISRLGKQSGVQFVCVADITPALRSSQISARILNVETAEVVTVGVAESQLRTMDDLRKASSDVVTAMFRKLYPDEYPAEVTHKRVRLGVRVGYNNTHVSGLAVKVRDLSSLLTEKYDTYYNEIGLGSGAELGLSILVHLSGAASVNIAPGVIMRNPVNTDVVEISEIAISFPALLYWKIPKAPVHAICGLQLDVPVSSNIKWAGEKKEKFTDERAVIDLGIVLGASVNVTEKIPVDVRGVIGVREFDNEKGRFLNQISVGVGYIIN